MTVSGKQSNHLSIEEALSTLTHQCRSKPGLKLRPESCEIRKSKKQKIANEKSFDIFWECRDCPGPVPRGGEVQLETKPKEAKGGKKRRGSMKAKRQMKPPGPCNICGRGPDEAKFYPSQRSRCIECMKAAKRSKAQADAQSTEESSTMAQNPQEEALAESPRQEEAVPMTYECPIHGRHSGRMFGRSHSKLCPACHTEKMKVRMKAAANSITSTCPSSMTVPQWVADWCAEQAGRNGASPMEYLIGQVAMEIPADWLKDWLVRKG